MAHSLHDLVLDKCCPANNTAVTKEEKLQVGKLNKKCIVSGHISYRGGSTPCPLKNTFLYGIKPFLRGEIKGYNINNNTNKEVQEQLNMNNEHNTKEDQDMATTTIKTSTTAIN